MKIKISWPTGIVIALTAFVIFILSFVYKVMFLPEYDHHLVSDNYYKDDLEYQDEIDKQNRALELSENVEITTSEKGIHITFPAEFHPLEISGMIYMQRMSNIDYDFKMPIRLDSREFLVDDELLVKGRWDIKVDWKAKNKKYLLKKRILY